MKAKNKRHFAILSSILFTLMGIRSHADSTKCQGRIHNYEFLYNYSCVHTYLEGQGIHIMMELLLPKTRNVDNHLALIGYFDETLVVRNTAFFSIYNILLYQ